MIQIENILDFTNTYKVNYLRITKDGFRCGDRVFPSLEGVIQTVNTCAVKWSNGKVDRKFIDTGNIIPEGYKKSIEVVFLAGTSSYCLSFENKDSLHNFTHYVKKVRQLGKGLDQVVTRFTLSPAQFQHLQYMKVLFEMVGDAITNASHGFANNSTDHHGNEHVAKDDPFADSDTY